MGNADGRFAGIVHLSERNKAACARNSPVEAVGPLQGGKILRTTLLALVFLKSSCGAQSRLFSRGSRG